jgi:LmbE family N-acetylglucosaminyl deacetylase
MNQMRSQVLNFGPMFGKSFLLSAALTCTLFTFGQHPAEQPSSSEILHRLQTLNTLGSVLYIAAHPDDENTRLISYLANGKHVRTGYLSLTRGSGGQNLIGSELGDGLGLIRTNELLEARRIDGGVQYFSRAVDFGYSKTADETFVKWGKQEILNDVVRVIRHFRPDVIITRFPPTSRAGHGHHQASAILALEAFDLAADPNAFPEHADQGLAPWKVKRMFWNGSLWWDRKLPEIADSEPDWVELDVGIYDPLLGLSYTELAGKSRSMHKSQGFGAAETKGSLKEYLHFEKGASIEREDIFEGIDMSWNRIIGGSGVGQLITQIMRRFDPSKPERVADSFELLHKEISALPESYWRNVKLEQLEQLMIDVTATSIEALVVDPLIPAGTMDSASIELLTRANFPVDLVGLKMPGDTEYLTQSGLLTNQMTVVRRPFKAPLTIDQPFWLTAPHNELFSVEDPMDIGNAVLPQNLQAQVKLKIAGVVIERSVPMRYKWVDRVDGERIRSAIVTPRASLRPSRTIVIDRTGEVKLQLEVESLVDDLSGSVELNLPAGWQTTEQLRTVQGLAKGERQTFDITLSRTNDAAAGTLRFSLISDQGVSEHTMNLIEYDHILPQVHYTPAAVSLIPLDVKVTAKRVGYIEGAGDKVPEALKELGLEVENVDTKTADLADLAQYDAIVAGIRAYNTDPELKHFNTVLLEYVKQGGTLLVQYNTNRGLMDNIGPYPFKVTRNRVTIEEAEATVLLPEHPIMNSPNKIGPEDFQNWVQERGLYFTDEVDPSYAKLISWGDTDDELLDGALITCDYGEGRFVYTGISFFRQLPAGVPGAYRLFANLISRNPVE